MLLQQHPLAMHRTTYSIHIVSCLFDFTNRVEIKEKNLLATLLCPIFLFEQMHIFFPKTSYQIWL